MTRVFLTGGSGLVGRNFLSHPSTKKYDIIAPRHDELDLNDIDKVYSFLEYYKPDFIIHAAAKVGGIKSNMNNLFDYLYDNTIIGFNLINSAKKLKIPKMINLGSSCMYPKNIERPLTEDDLLTGRLEETNEGYAIAKLSVAKLCLFALQQSGLEYKTLIPCNLYGIGDKFDPEKSHMIPSAIRKIHYANKEKTNVVIWGSGTARREFMFAEDLADFIHFSLENFEKLPPIMNVGNGFDMSVLDYYETTKKVLKADVKFKLDNSYPDGMKQKLLNVKIQKSLGWSPKISLEEGIEKTYQHFLEVSNEKY